MVRTYPFCLLIVMQFFAPLTIEAKKERQTIEERNQKADLAYLTWKLESPHSKISSELRKTLTSKAVAFIAKESQLPFEKTIKQADINKKIQSITTNFIKKFAPKAVNVNEREVAELIEKVIKPEFLFKEAANPVNELDKSYNELLANLAEEETPLGTTLKEWALRFLASESLDVTLPIIERVAVNGKDFNQLAPKEQQEILELAASLITQRFMSNLRAVRTKFKFDLPLFTDEAVKQKVIAFLKAKFVS